MILKVKHCSSLRVDQQTPRDEVYGFFVLENFL